MEKNLDTHYLEKIKTNCLRYIEIPSFSEFPDLVTGFTTRFGGVSSENYATLNLSFNRSDPKDNVFENYRLLCEDLRIPVSNLVLSHQTHTANVMTVSKEHSGMGITKKRSYSNIDGLLTNESSLVLVTHYADCVPMYFYDPVKKVIGLAHSGWRGTLKDIGGQTIKKLNEVYGSEPSDINVAFGPHIRNCCFEVDGDVATLFKKNFTHSIKNMVCKNNGKWVIDLESIITNSLIRHGVSSNNIYKCDICTKCHSEIFFSHRGSNGNTGTGAAFIVKRR